MTDVAAARPIALQVIPEGIPSDFKAYDQWVCWRYELNAQGKWTKVPYTPGTTRRAKSNTRKTWRSFADALACLRERPDFFDGIGFCPHKDDPFVLGDIDHSQDTDRLPPTYAERSPGGNGSRFVAIASGYYHKKRPAGELYSERQFMTITGHVLPGHEAITDCQAEIEAFAKEIGSTQRTVKEGSAGSGSRAELVKDIPESEWAAGRVLYRTQINRLLARVRAAAKEETQLAFLLRGDYAGFHQKWPFVGLYRADGSLDNSQVRAVAATGIKGRGFTFPEYAAIMSHLYAADALAKWGTMQAWREELAALWSYAPAPHHAPRPAKQAKVPRGRAGDHAELVERVYQILLDHRAGAEAIVKAGDLADVIKCHRRTVVSILNELRAANRIQTRRLGQYGGLVVTFSDVIYSAAQEAVQTVATPEIELAPPALEETKNTNCVSSDRASDDHILPPTPPPLASLVAEYLDHYTEEPRRRVRKRTTANGARGEVTYTEYVHTADRFVAFVAACLPAHVWPEAELRDAYKAVRKAREAEYWQAERAKLRAMQEPKELYRAIEARRKGLDRNIGRRLEGRWRWRLQIAEEERQRRGLPPKLAQAAFFDQPTARAQRQAGAP